METEYNQGLIERTKQAREASPYVQEEVAEFLGLKQGTWKQYETRTPIPQYLIPRFTVLVQCDIYWLLSGDGPAPKPVPSVKPHRARRIPRKG